MKSSTFIHLFIFLSILFRKNRNITINFKHLTYITLYVAKWVVKEKENEFLTFTMVPDSKIV